MTFGRADLESVAVARKCLERIRDIADRGALSWDVEQVGFALQELSQVLLERTGCDERVFEPMPPSQIDDLQLLLEELVFVDAVSQDMARPN